MKRSMMGGYVKGSDRAVERYKKAYDVLKEGAEVRIPLGPCEYSALMVDLVDQFGVRWCMFA